MATVERNENRDVCTVERVVRGAEPPASIAGHPRSDPFWSHR